MVHGVGGTIGCLLTGVFAAPVLVPAEYFPRSAEILASGGNFAMFLAQLQGVIFSYLWIGIFTAIILLIIKATVGLRVTPDEEERGLDFVAHGEEAYDPMTN
jgi:Amt family ammonium transporter